MGRGASLSSDRMLSIRAAARAVLAALVCIILPACGSDNSNGVPTANDQALVTAEDTPLALTLAGSDPEGAGLSYAIVQPPAHGVLSGTLPALTYSPNPDYNGTDQFSFSASDGISTSNVALISFTINAVNDAPQATTQAVSTAEDTPKAIILAGGDVDGDPLTFQILSSPSHGALSGSLPAITYTPGADYHGADSFTFRVSDGSLFSAGSTVTLTVDAVNDAPVATSDIAQTSVNAGVTIDVLPNDSDVDGDALSVTNATAPAHGSLLVNPNNTITYTPANGFLGTDGFDYTMSDGNGGSATASVLVGVGEFPKGLSIARVSVFSGGGQVAGQSGLQPPGYCGVSISWDGRFVAFQSASSDLVNGDTNGVSDVFVHDRLTRQTVRVSLATDGSEGNGASYFPSISSDGRSVAFLSAATNLVALDTNGTVDVFVHDRQTGSTQRVSLSSGGFQSTMDCDHPSLSGDGRYVAFDSYSPVLVAGDTNAVGDIFVHDRATQSTIRASVDSSASQSNGASQVPYVSADGRYVTFTSVASNLVAGDVNTGNDLFIRDTVAGTTTRVNVRANGAEDQGFTGLLQSPSTSNGRLVAFTSGSDTLIPSDTNGQFDVFLKDLLSGSVSRVSVRSDGQESNSSCAESSISDDGRFVVFISNATNLDLSGDMNATGDVYLHDNQTGETRRISVASNGTHGNLASSIPRISGNGHYVVFASLASNLIDGDTNQVGDVFVVPNPLAP